MIRRLSSCLLPLAILTSTGASSPDLPEVAPPPREQVTASPPVPPTPKLPLSKLAHAKPMFDACLYRYGVGTTNRQCQAYVNQALGMYYSYVWIESVRAAETALTYDPECAYAWLILNRGFEKWGAGAAVPKVTGLGSVLGTPGLAILPESMTRS
ncbi:MAG TPA: hypothetical protein VG122_04940, partial [Gemmata sp.]|nr:hypothetical protein [Gemmata sp.]